MKAGFDNSAHINFYRSGYICLPTNATSVEEFMGGMERIADKYSINIFDMRITSIKIKDLDGNVLDKREPDDAANYCWSTICEDIEGYFSPEEQAEYERILREQYKDTGININKLV